MQSKKNEGLLAAAEIAFDAGSGISEEEQREILAKINSITEKNRLSLSSGADKDDEKGSKHGSKRRFKAQKSGSLFPVLVNAAAITLLAGGFFIFSSFQEKTDAQVREGTKVYNSAERILIEEIRKETFSRIEAKENEISQIIFKLEDVDAELRELHSSNLELNSDQQNNENRLKALQEEYRAALATLQDERSRILEDARSREAVLQAQLENRTRELALVAEHSAAAIDLAQAEMDLLTREQTQAATIEAQMGAFFANLNGQINENRLEEASETIKTMRNFLNTPVFQGLRSIQARKELYLQSINSFETMIEEARRNQAALAAGVRPLDENEAKTFAALQEKTAELEQAIEEKDKTIEAFSAQGSGMSRRLAELQKSESDLRTANSALQGTVNRLEANSRERDGRIANLETESARLTQSANSAQQTAAARQTEIETLRQTVSTRDGTINDLRGQVTARNDTISNIQDIVQGRAITDMTVGQLTESLTRIQQALGSN